MYTLIIQVHTCLQADLVGAEESLVEELQMLAHHTVV